MFLNYLSRTEVKYRKIETQLSSYKNIATRWDPYIIWWDPYDSYPHDSDLFILFEVCNNSLKGSSYIIYPILYTLIYYPICAIIIIRAYILKLKFDFRFNQIAQGNVESPVRSNELRGIHQETRLKLSKIALISLKMLPNTKIQIFLSSISNVEI